MRYLLAHRTRRILFLFLLLPTVAVAYMTLPRGDVRLPAENVRARTQDIAIPGGAPSIARGRFMQPPTAYVSQGVTVRTPADEAAITELALTTAAPIPSSPSLPGAAVIPQAAPSSAVIETSTATADRGRRSSSQTYPELLARGMEGAAFGVSGTSRPASDSGAAAPALTALSTQTTQATPTTNTSSTTSAPTASSSSSSSSSTATNSRPGPAAPAAVTAGGQNALENTEDTEAEANVAQVFSAPAAGPRPASPSAGGSPAGQPSDAPSPTPEPATMLLMASGLAIAYGARRYVS